MASVCIRTLTKRRLQRNVNNVGNFNFNNDDLSNMNYVSNSYSSPLFSNSYSNSYYPGLVNNVTSILNVGVKWSR